MNTHIKKFSALLGASMLALGSSFAQNKEYDDLYFTSNDRTQVKKVEVDNKVVQDPQEVQQQTEDPQESYSAKNVNPEYIARYQSKTQDDYSSDSEYSSDEYFDDDYTGNDVNSAVNSFQNDADVVVRDRYGNTSYYRDFTDVYWSDPFYYQGTIFDPFYTPYYRYNYRPYRSGWSVSFGFGNTWGWRSGWHTGFSIGYGWGWGSAYCDPFYYSYYDPYYYRPYYYNSYYGYGYPYNNVVVINNYETRSNRTLKRGPGMSRSGEVTDNSRGRRGISSSGDNGTINSGRSSTGRVASSDPRGRYINTDSRDYSGTQSRYYRRSREAVSNSSDATSSSSRSYDSRSRSSSNYTSGSDNSRSSRSYSRSYNNSNSNSGYNYRNSSRSGSNSRSYSTPSRSRSNSYSGNSSRSSRSSSSYSSGSSRSSSSYSSGSSRSSSSGSRSSSGSSRSRRGN